MNHLPQDATLIVIDVQQAFNNPAWGTRNNPQAEQHIAMLLAGWRASARPIIHVHHRSQHPDSHFFEQGPGVRVKPEAAPLDSEPVIYKSVNSSFIGTGLEARLRAAGTRTLVVAGITTDHCVSTTVRMAGNFGFDTILAGDATATFDRRGVQGEYFSADVMYATALASINGEFARVRSSVDVLAML